MNRKTTMSSVKKPNPKNPTVKGLVELVHQVYPDFPVTAADLVTPTTNFVFNFYRKCMDDLDQKLEYASGKMPEPFPSWLAEDHGEEMVLFHRLRRIPELANGDFKLYDLTIIYPNRLHEHMQMTLRYIMMFDSHKESMRNIRLEAEQKAKESEMKQNELTAVINECYNTKAELGEVKARNLKLKDQHAELSPQYQRADAAMMEIEKKCETYKTNINRLLKSYADLKEQIARLEQHKQYLQSQLVKVDEYEAMVRAIEDLSLEGNNVNEINEENKPQARKEHFNNMVSVLEGLKLLPRPQEPFELPSLRNLAYNLKTEIETMQNRKQQMKEEVQSLAADLLVALEALRTRERHIQDSLKVVKEEEMKCVKKLHKKYLKKFEELQAQIGVVRSGVETIESDIAEVVESFKRNVQMMCKAFCEQVLKKKFVPID